MKYDFDKWRAEYDAMTLEDQIKAHDDIGALYPDQAHYDLDRIKEVLRNKQINRVMEAGPWKGDLAHAILSDPEFDHITAWVGVEICEYARANTVVTDPRFTYYIPQRFDWWHEQAFNILSMDIFIGTHFIEHLSDRHLYELAAALYGYSHIYFEAPISIEGQTWDGYEGTHMLQYGWKQVLNMFPFHHCNSINEGDSIVHLYL